MINQPNVIFIVSILGLWNFVKQFYTGMKIELRRIHFYLVIAGICVLAD